MSKLLDTWAWIEFYEGTETGEKIYQMIESEKTIYTSIITLAELSDNYHRGNFETDHSWTQIEKFIENKSQILGLKKEIAREAGKIKERQRKKFPDFGLMDAIILSTARRKGIDLISGEKHLKSQERTEKI